jgi:hypothetical protein
MTVVQDAYGRALADHAELAGRLEALHAKAVALGVAEQGDVARGYALAAETLHRHPCPLSIAEQLVGLYVSYLAAATSGRRTSKEPRP